jgi:hypothetical protein
MSRFSVDFWHLYKSQHDLDMADFSLVWLIFILLE